ncbi:MAG: homoserine dehydrogenase, partial [Acidobacteriaceae bacterium]
AEHINIDALFQRPGFEKGSLPFVVTVEPCAASALRRALDRIAHASWLTQPPLDMPMLGE